MDTEVRVVDRVGAIRCELESGKARLELGKNINARYVGTDKFYLSLLGLVSGRDACHRCCTGFVLQSLSIP
jgi:hypothetical protein